MNTSQFIEKYTAGKPFRLRHVFREIHELIVEIVKLNKNGVKEEFEDVFHLTQLWLYWRFGINGELWNITKKSVKKFMDRKIVWNRIYIYVGLSENISGYSGNYRKIQKVINHLRRFGIDKEKAEEAFRNVVLQQ